MKKLQFLIIISAIFAFSCSKKEIIADFLISVDDKSSDLNTIPQSYVVGDKYITMEKATSAKLKLIFTNKSQSEYAVVFYGDAGHIYGTKDHTGQDITFGPKNHVPMPVLTELTTSTISILDHNFTATLLATNTSDAGKNIETKTTNKSYKINYTLKYNGTRDLSKPVKIDGKEYTKTELYEVDVNSISIN
ncbi:MAG: hypothetical protein NW207_02510 [Cytophagales bacterium]|nr:hypothetical protein [Cytophagales bacterium]